MSMLLMAVGNRVPTGTPPTPDTGSMWGDSMWGPSMWGNSMFM